MIEKTVQDHLTELLQVPVAMEERPELGETFVVIVKTGSGVDNYLWCSTLALKSYAPTLYEAACLNEEVKAAMDRLSEREDVTRARFNTDYNYTDTGSKRYRYQAVYDIYHY